jgi:hypothetical protein
MSREEALKILVAQGYCNVGKELSCKDCPCYTGNAEVCPTNQEITEAVRIIEQEL